MLYLIYSTAGSECPHPLTLSKALLLAYKMHQFKPSKVYYISPILDI